MRGWERLVDLFSANSFARLGSKIPTPFQICLLLLAALVSSYTVKLLCAATNYTNTHLDCILRRSSSSYAAAEFHWLGTCSSPDYLENLGVNNMTERFQDICVLLHCCKANPLLRCIREWGGGFVPSLTDPLAGIFDLPGQC